MVAGQYLPGGEYRFVQAENSAVVQIYSKAQGHLATVLCQRVPAIAEESERLVFHRARQDAPSEGDPRRGWFWVVLPEGAR